MKLHIESVEDRVEELERELGKEEADSENKSNGEDMSDKKDNVKTLK